VLLASSLANSTFYFYRILAKQEPKHMKWISRASDGRASPQRCGIHEWV